MSSRIRNRHYWALPVSSPTVTESGIQNGKLIKQADDIKNLSGLWQIN